MLYERALRVITTSEELAKVAPPSIIINGATREVTSKAEGEESITALPSDTTKLADLIVKLLQEQ